MGKPTQNRKFSNKGRSKRTFTKGETKEERIQDRINDPEWYVKEPQLAKDVASFSFNNAAGANYYLAPDSPGTNFNPGAFDLSSMIPGIMTMYTGPAVNPSNSAYSALNLATKDLFKRVRKMNAGSTNYDSPDLMLYVLAMDSIYSAIFFMQRIYGCANVYSQVNRYVGDAFIEAQGIIPSTVRENLAWYRARLNMLITKVSAFATPRDINLFKRHAWMYSGIYMDEPCKKAQVYMYVPAYIYKYIETTGAPGSLRPQYLCTAYDTVTTGTPKRLIPRTASATNPNARTISADAMFHYIEECVSAVVESQDMNIMSGDILKAYGDEGIWKMALIDENYATVPVYSDEVLDQIHNTTFVGCYPTSNIDLDQPITYNDDRLSIYQAVESTGNYLMYRPQFANMHGLSYTHILDMCDDNPSPERVLVATRNMVSGSTAQITAEGSANTFITDINTCGSDMCFCGSMWILSPNGFSGQEFGYQSATYPWPSRYGRFHKAPIVYRTNATGTINDVYGEVGNFTLINSDDLQKLHESAMLSLLGVSV